MQNTQLQSEIGSEPYITGYTLRTLASQGIMSSQDSVDVRSLGCTIDPHLVKDGDILFVPIDFLDHFFNDIHPHIDAKYKLISSKSDLTLTDKYEKFIDDKIIHWWSINNELTHEKVSSIPLGLDNKHWRFRNNPQGETSILTDIIHERVETSKSILMSFRISTNEKERQKCYDTFKEVPSVEIINFKDQDRFAYGCLHNYYRKVKQHMFTLCPFGNGYDCHRIWQVLYLGAVPIIKRHKTMESFYNLPVWWIDDWNEVLETNIKEKFETIKSKTYNKEIMFFDYWKRVINETR